ncbi:MAG: DnaJ domain-containing protein [Nitrospiraceae bacterium]
MAFDFRKLRKYQDGMRRRIDLLRTRSEQSLDFAIENMMEARTDSYFRVEQGLEEISLSLISISEELTQVSDLSNAIRLESRLEFMEDRWDEMDSEARERPRRRKKKFNLADFLKTAGGEAANGAGRDGIRTTFEAYQALGLEDGSSLLEVTRAFRIKAKGLHPDSNEGDRSHEPELRRIIEAYQLLKEALSLSNVEPPRHPDRPYDPHE